jgi:hypothetical protein
MNTERIKQLAEQAGLDWHKHWNDEEGNRLEKFAALVAAAEREACVELCVLTEQMCKAIGLPAAAEAVEACAEAIRARGNDAVDS